MLKIPVDHFQFDFGTMKDVAQVTITDNSTTAIYHMRTLVPEAAISGMDK